MSNVENIDDWNVFEPGAEIAYDLMDKHDRDQLQTMATDILIALRDHPWKQPVESTIEPGDQTLGEKSATGIAVSASGVTRSAAKFQEWRDSGVMRENVEGELRYQYSDDCYIDVDYGRLHRVILGNGEYEFVNLSEAQRFLWNNFSKDHFDAGEVE